MGKQKVINYLSFFQRQLPNNFENIKKFLNSLNSHSLSLHQVVGFLIFFIIKQLNVFVQQTNIEKINQMQNQNYDKIPVLMFLLNENKLHEVLKAMLNKQVAKNLLEEYGDKSSSECTKTEQYVLNKYISRFSIAQIIDLKGSSLHRTKEYYNVPLREMIRRKLLHEEINNITRKAFWIQLSQYFLHPSLYENLRYLQLATDFVSIIEKDILRTYISGQVKAKAKEVLQYFSHYNPYVGYCQGMNTISAFLISQGFSCKQAFFILKRVTEDILPCDYYSNMDTIMAYTRIFYECLSIVQPQIYHHLKKLSQELDSTYVMVVSFVFQWFVCLFCNDNIHLEITQIIWDFLLVEGMTVLFKAAFAIFELLKPQILSCKDFESYTMMQNQAIRKITNAQFIRKKIVQIYISPQILFLLKQKLVQPAPKDFGKERSTRSKHSDYKRNCNHNLNVCLQALQDNLQQNKHFQIFVFKPAGQINIIPNYLQTLNKQYFRKQTSKSKTDLLMIGRIQHVCRGSSDIMTEVTSSNKNQRDSSSSNEKKEKTSNGSPGSNKSSLKSDVSELRQRVVQKINELTQKTGLIKSQSMMFMEEMAKNASISNLLEVYDVDELFQ